MNGLKLVLAGALGAVMLAGVGGAAGAAEDGPKIERQSWPFAGIFGRYDPAALQRGFQIYSEVCKDCHSMKYVYYRNLGEAGGPGFTAAEVEAIAAEFEVEDGPDDSGDMFTRPALPRDHFRSPFANDQQARASNNGALPPDLSVMAKARGIERGFPWWFIDVFTGYQEQGADYIYAILSGYEDAPADVTLQDGMSYNKYFPGHQIAMVSPLPEDRVDYADGTPTTVAQMAHDVSSFLMWTAEPKLVERKRIGFQVMLFLGVFAVLLYLAKKKVWARIEH